MRQTCKMETVEVRTVIKCLRKKGMTPKGIHEDFMNATRFSLSPVMLRGFLKFLLYVITHYSTSD